MGTRARSFRLEMLQVARLAPKVLGEATGLVEQFLRSQMTEGGGFADREGRADLYYSVFGLEGLLALQAEIPKERITRYLDGFGDGVGLDFVHLCSLARCLGGIGLEGVSEERKIKLAERVEGYRAQDGGYHGSAGKQRGSAYGALLAWGTYADLGLSMPTQERMLQSVQSLQLEDGSFSNEPGLMEGSTTATAAAVTLLRHLNQPPGPATGAWIQERLHPNGGFLAMPRAPLPDLLSTATALHALDSLEVSLDSVRESCLDFVDSLWSAQGGFHGHWADDELDVEYTSYGLLALGHLNV